jgi:hypothetical protein
MQINEKEIDPLSCNSPSTIIIIVFFSFLLEKSKNVHVPVLDFLQHNIRPVLIQVKNGEIGLFTSGNIERKVKIK